MQMYQPLSNSGYDWSRLTLRGPDSTDFLNRLSSASLNGLVDGQTTPALFLNSQGKIQSYFHLTRQNSQEYILELDPGKDAIYLDRLKQHVEMYTFGEKIELISSDPILKCMWIFEGSTIAVPQHCTLVAHGSTDFGRAWMTLWGPSEALPQATEIISAETLKHWQIQSLRPWTNSEIQFESNPLELGLAEAIASNKGCYPGQEIVEKIISLGAPAKRLCRIRGDFSHLGTDLQLMNETGAAPVGQITRFMPQSALALIRKTHAQPGTVLKLGTGTSVRVEQVSAYVSDTAS